MFELDGNQRIQISPDILNIPEFKSIHEEDKTKDKSKSYSIFEYIYYMCDPESPYNNYPSEIKEKQVIKDFIKDKEFNAKDKLILKAIDKYNELVKVPEHYLLEAARERLFSLAKWLGSAPIRDGANGNTQSIIKALENLPKTLASFESLKLEVSKKAAAEGKKKGSSRRGNRES